MIFRSIYKKYIKGTDKKAIVQLVQVFVCHLTSSVSKGIKCGCNKVYISTRVIKHVYDKRSAEEFDFLIDNIHLVIKYPDKVYKNKNGKRGSFCFVKKIKNFKYFCSIETTKKDEQGPICEIVTFFRVDEDYLKNYKLLWEWKGDNPHRSAFDSSKLA